MQTQPHPPGWALSAALACATLGACAGSREVAMQRELDTLGPGHGAPPAGQAPAKQHGPLTSLEDVLVAAMERSSELKAAYHEARAASLHVESARRLPDPRLTYGYFIRNVETRVGPQRHRFGISQTIPWPTRLSANAEAQSARAQAATRKLEATRLALRLRVSRTYYRLWQLHHEREVERSQLSLLEGLSEAARTALSAGRTTLAGVSQLDLSLSRRRDRLVGLEEQTRAATAELLGAAGLPSDTPLELRYPPLEPALPAEDEAALQARAEQHPLIDSMETMAVAGDERSRSAAADRLPSFTLGVDYIETGDARQPGVPDSGKDPIIAMVSVSLPIWFGSYDGEADAHRAEASALRAQAANLRDGSRANVSRTLSQVRDTARRIAFYQGTLEPQAKAAFQSVTSAYAAGRGGVAAVLLAQRELLEIALERVAAQAAHASAWAELEHLVGSPVAREEVAP